MNHNTRLTKTFIGAMTLAAIAGTVYASLQVIPCTRLSPLPCWRWPRQLRG